MGAERREMRPERQKLYYPSSSQLVKNLYFFLDTLKGFKQYSHITFHFKRVTFAPVGEWIRGGKNASGEIRSYCNLG